MRRAILSALLAGLLGVLFAKPLRAGEDELPPPRSMDAPAVAAPPVPPPLRLADAIRLSLANVRTVQANVEVQTATVGRFEALKSFVPLVSLPQLMVAFRRFTGPDTSLLGPFNLIMPDVTDGVLLNGRPGLDQAALNRFFFYFPLDPSGHITALPVAEEGIHAKVLMEQVVRRSQVMLAIQDYFESKQIEYGIGVARLGVTVADETLGRVQRKLVQKQAHEVEVSQARVDASKAGVLLLDLEKSARIRQRHLAVTLHQCRLLVPQSEPRAIALDPGYRFDLDDPDTVDLTRIPYFPRSRADAIEMAKRQRAEVRLLVVGLRIAQLKQKGSLLSLLGMGRLPAELGFKGTTPGNGHTTLGAIFGGTYALPVVDLGLWANIRKARLDVVQSQLDLEKELLEVAADAGNAWDRWQQSLREWEQREAELRLQREYLEREQRLYEQKQAIPLEVLAARLNWVQADANRWTAWYNVQLARLDILRATELLLDYVEKAGIADLRAGQKPPPQTICKRWLPWLASKKSQQAGKEEARHEQP